MATEKPFQQSDYRSNANVIGTSLKTTLNGEGVNATGQDIFNIGFTLKDILEELKKQTFQLELITGEKSQGYKK